jgi:hypothetical protein
MDRKKWQMNACKALNRLDAEKYSPEWQQADACGHQGRKPNSLFEPPVLRTYYKSLYFV